MEKPEKSSQDLLPIVKEYENMIDTLTTQVEFYAREQENLRKEISILITENKVLSETVNELLSSQKDTNAENEQKQVDKELLENLKIQMNLTLQEKDTVVQLWQSALRNIDHLEEELKLFQGRTHGYFSKAEVVKIKQKYENQIDELEQQLTKCHSKLEAATKESARNLENKNADLKKAVESQENTTRLVKRLETDVTQLQNKLKEIMVMRDKLQLRLDKKNDQLEELKIKDFEAKAKVTEAIQVVEAAFFEKDAAILREKVAKEEVIKISKTLSEVIDEASERVKNEIAKVKQEYNMKMRKTEQEVQQLKEKLSAKGIQLEKYLRECKLLEEELERVKKGNISIDESNTSKLLILEKNLESTFQKLLLSERKNLQVTAEKESIKADLEQMANCYENDIKAREVEKQVLKHEIQLLKKQLKISKKSLIQVAGEIDKMNSKIKLLDVEVQNKLQAKVLLYEQALAKTVEEIQSKNKKVQDEMETQLDLQVVLNKKWRKEVNEMIDKLENRIKDLKEVNKSLRKKYKKALSATSHYRNNLTKICTNNKNVNKDSQSIK